MWLISKSETNFDSISPTFDWNFDVYYFISQGQIHPKCPSKLVLGPNLSPILENFKIQMDFNEVKSMSIHKARSILVKSWSISNLVLNGFWLDQVDPIRVLII